MLSIANKDVCRKQSKNVFYRSFFQILSFLSVLTDSPASLKILDNLHLISIFKKKDKNILIRIFPIMLSNASYEFYKYLNAFLDVLSYFVFYWLSEWVQDNQTTLENLKKID